MNSIYDSNGEIKDDVRDEMKYMLCNVVRLLLLPKWRAFFRMRTIVIYWMQESVKRAHAPNGVGRKRDLDAFELDFVE